MADFEDDIDPQPPQERVRLRAIAGGHRARRKRVAEEWALVLTAEGYSPKLVRDADLYAIEVDGHDAEAADASLTSWQAERAERAATKPLPAAPEATSVDLGLAYASALCLLAFHLGLEWTGSHQAYVDRGNSQAALVLSGQIWRVLTALTLHEDLSHVAGNTLFGGFFLAALTGRLGLGCSILAFLVSGTLGNFANAAYYGSAHSSIGASTGVFGLVGVLAGLAAWRRHRMHAPKRGAWIAFAAGLGVVAMLGGPGQRIDFAAHLFGLAAGALTGVLISIPLAFRTRPGLPAQIAAAVASALLVLGAWRLA